MNPLNPSLRLPVLLCALFLLNETAIAGASTQSRCHYQVISDGVNVGEVTLSYDHSPHKTIVLEHSRLTAAGWWGRWELHSQTIEQYTRDGQLETADNKIREDNTAHWIQLDKHDDEYWATASTVKKLSQRDTDELIELTSVLANSLAPNVAEVLSLSSALLKDRKAEKQGLRLPTDSFHTTLNHLPLWLKQFDDQPLPENVILLDMESLQTTKMKLQNHGQKRINFKAYQGLARHMTLTPKKGEPLEIWLPANNGQPPCAIEMRGQDDDGELIFRTKQ